MISSVTLTDTHGKAGRAFDVSYLIIWNIKARSLICAMRRSYFLRFSWWFSRSLNTPVKLCLNQPAGMKSYNFCHKKRVSVKNRLTKRAWETSERLLQYLKKLLEKRAEIQQSFPCWGAAVMGSFQADEWAQWEQANGGLVCREKKLLAPGRALLPARGCLAFLLMAGCASQLPNPFPQCANSMQSVLPAREFTQAVFLRYYEGSLLLDLWQKRDSVSRAGVFSIW